MWNSILEELPHKKKTKMSPSSSSLSSLPDEIVLSCLSRVSRSDQPALSMVSKSYRSLVASPEIYKTRKLYGYTENCTYVCLRTSPDRIPRWFILPRGKLSPIPFFSSQAEEGSSVVVLDGGIYVIGGVIKGELTSNVLLLDCRTHIWHRLPSMGVPRCSPVTGVIGGKIYVFGGGSRLDSPNWAECFDPKTQNWVTLPPMLDRHMRGQYTHSSVVVRDEKVYGVDLVERTFYYSPSEGKWGRGSDSEVFGIRRDWCVIGNIIYSCDRFGNLCWCEIEQLERQGEELMNWRKVQGLDFLQTKLNDSRLIHINEKLDAISEASRLANGHTQKLVDHYPGYRLSSSGPNIVVFWDLIEGDYHDIWEEDHLEIWCAEISLERRHATEIWGSIEWSHPVMTVDPFSHRYKVLHSVCVTI